MKSHNAHTDEHWEKIAEDYREAYAKNGGKIRGITILMAEKWSVPRNTMNVWIRDSRKYGFLEPFSHRPCSMCGQPVARNHDGELLVMELNAWDYEQRCTELGNVVAAGWFRRAAEALARQTSFDKVSA